MRSGITASAPSDSKRSTMWLLAVGENFTRISPTMPTFGLWTFVRSKLSKSWMMPRIFFTKVIIPALFVESALTQIFFHFSWRAFAEPGTAS